MELKCFYFDLEHAVREHDFIIDKSGGRHGINNIGLLDSVLEHMKNDIYYPSFEDKVSYLCYSIIKNHAFTDGNKRTALVLTSYFMELNGLTYCINRFILEMENFAIYVAANFIDQDLFYSIITSIIYQSDYNEDLKIEIAQALRNQLEDFGGDTEENDPY